MIIVLAIYLVKLIFRFELLSQFVAKLTGAEFASNAVFKANQVVNKIMNKNLYYLYLTQYNVHKTNNLISYLSIVTVQQTTMPKQIK